MESSAEVAEWGEQWLRDWIAEPGIPDDERSTREWLADGWRKWTLDEWVHSANRDRLATGGYQWDQFMANHAAGNHLSLYRREASGLLVWRMFSEYRRRGLQVPEHILGKFDAWAGKLEKASGIKGIAAAIEMTGNGGGPQGAAHLRKVERQRRIVSDVQQLVALGLGVAEAKRRVAAERQLSFGAVHSAWNRWQSGPRTRDKARNNSESDSHRRLRRLAG